MIKLTQQIDDWNFEFNFSETIPYYCWEKISEKYKNKKLDKSIFQEIVNDFYGRLIYMFGFVDDVLNSDLIRTKIYKEEIMVEKGYFSNKPLDLIEQEKAKLDDFGFRNIVIFKKWRTERRLMAISYYLCGGLLLNYCEEEVILSDEKIKKITFDIYSRFFTLVEHVENIKFLASVLVEYYEKLKKGK